jgi:hypothetical protein
MRFSSLAALSLFLLPMAAYADVSLYKTGDAEVVGSLKAEGGFFATRDTNFGGAAKRDRNWSEWYVKPKLTGSYNIGGAEGRKIYGGTSLVGSMTQGDGDASGFTNGTPEQLNIDLAYAGFNSGTLPGKPLGFTDVDISTGRNFFTVGDGFLIGDPHFDQGKEGGFYLSPREAFQNTAIVKLNGEPWRADLFWLRAGWDQANASVIGANAEYQVPKSLRLGGLFLNSVQAADNTLQPLEINGRPNNPNSRNGLKTASGRFQGTVDQINLPNWLFSGEYAQQWNNESRQEVQANAWYLEAGYTFANLRFKPMLSYRYASFSGDKAETTGTDEGFDPMFYGYSRGRGTWFLGEVIGQYLISNSNVDLHQVHLKGQLTENIGVGTLYYHYRRNEQVVSAPSDKTFAQEIDTYADIKVNDHLSFALVYAVAFPEAAAKAEYSSSNRRADNPYHTAFAVATISF